MVVTTSLGENVTSTGREISESVRGSTKYVAVTKVPSENLWRWSVYQLRNPDFYDWEHLGNGVDSPAFLLTGHWTGGVASKDKRIPHLHTYFRRTEQGIDLSGNVIGPSSCNVQAQWEWTDSVAAGRFGFDFQAYKLPRFYAPEGEGDIDYGFTVVSTKNKVRGHGNALSLSFTSEPGKDMHIYGWVLDITEEET